MLSNTPVIPGLHANLFNVTGALKTFFQVTSEVEAVILRKKSTDIRFGDKMANKAGEGFLLITRFYKSANNAVLLVPNKQNAEVKAAVKPEGTVINKQ